MLGWNRGGGGRWWADAAHEASGWGARRGQAARGGRAGRRGLGWARALPHPHPNPCTRACTETRKPRVTTSSKDDSASPRNHISPSARAGGQWTAWAAGPPPARAQPAPAPASPSPSQPRRRRPGWHVSHPPPHPYHRPLALTVQRVPHFRTQHVGRERLQLGRPQAGLGGQGGSVQQLRVDALRVGGGRGGVGWRGRSRIGRAEGGRERPFWLPTARPPRPPALDDGLQDVANLKKALVIPGGGEHGGGQHPAGRQGL